MNNLERSAYKLVFGKSLKAALPQPGQVVLKCMETFFDGAWWGFNRAIKQPPHNPRPQTWTEFPKIIFDEIEPDKFVEYRLPPRHEIAVSIPYLRELKEGGKNLSDPQCSEQLQIDQNPFLGLPLVDFFGNTGVEEGDHAGFFALNTEPEIKTIEECGFDLSIYYLQPHELHAQVAAREYAQLYLPQESFERLLQVHAAIGLR